MAPQDEVGVGAWVVQEGGDLDAQRRDLLGEEVSLPGLREGVLLLWGEEPGVDAGLLGRRSLDVGAGVLGVVLLWVLRFVVHGRRVTGGGEWWLGAGVRVVGDGGPFECPQDRLRQASGRTDSRSGPALGCGASGKRGRLVVGMPRPSPLWIPAFAGMTSWAAGMKQGGCAGPRVLVTAVVGPASAGRALREAPLRRGAGGVGKRRGLVVGWGPARALPLWIPAFAGMTRGGRERRWGRQE